MRRKKYYRARTPEALVVKMTATGAYKRGPVVVIGPHGVPLYGAAAAAYLHHRGQRGGAYAPVRYGTKEWHRRMTLARRSR
jgi:hypothetical protein